MKGQVSGMKGGFAEPQKPPSASEGNVISSKLLNMKVSQFDLSSLVHATFRRRIWPSTAQKFIELIISCFCEEFVR